MTQIDVIGMIYCEASQWEILFFSVSTSFITSEAVLWRHKPWLAA